LNKINISLENCYGINSFTEELDFSRGKTIAIYAPNATMKTSFAKTFLELSRGRLPIDGLHGKEPICIVKADGNNIPKEEIFVIESMNKKFESTKLLTLLVDIDSMNEYNELNEEILSKKKSLVLSLNRVAGIKKDLIEQAMLNDFEETLFFNLLKNIDFDTEIEELSHIKYKDIFDPKVVDLLNSEEVLENINEYSTKYNELIKESSYFKEGVFNPLKAENIIKSTRTEKFFEADHAIILNGHQSKINSADEFNTIIFEEKNKILTNDKLKEIEAKISRGVKSVKEFQNILEQYPELIPYMTQDKYESLRVVLWKSYLKKNEDEVKDLLSSYEENRERIFEIEEEAKTQRTKWEIVVKEFKNRFYVPYEIYIENKKSMVLGNNTPVIKFKFEDVALDKDALHRIDILSQGEIRALYLLNIIFEIKSRKEEGQKTLFILDDIVDSFDYKNKYAIIEYIKEVTEVEYFYQIILTHNFDFFRTLQGRVMGGSRFSNSFMAQKDNNSIKLFKAGPKQVDNPFNFWKTKLDSDENILIAMIPFLRNIAEYIGDEVNENALTDLLHIKMNTKSISILDLENIIKSILHGFSTLSLPNSDKPENKVYNLIYKKANEIETSPIIEEVELEKKIVLSIAIRLKAEEFMILKINNQATVDRIGKPQTGKLFNKIKKDNLVTNEELKILELVNIITPENIHLNSFMYEPILDMSKSHLIDLYRNVKVL
jgi:hypothetical protein